MFDQLLYWPMFALSRENALWLALLLLSGLSRLIYLGATPLNDPEAKFALEALALSRGSGMFVANPLLGNLQAVVDFIFGASDTGARVPGALLASALPLAPWLARAQLGRARALAFGLLLALSPSIWFESRLADGSGSAWLVALAAFLMVGRASPVVLGTLIGALLAHGSAAFLPAIALALAVLADGRASALRGMVRPHFFISTAVVLFLASTLFGLFLPGLGSALGGLAQGATQLVANVPDRAISPSRLMPGLALYELLPLGLTVAALATLSTSPETRRENAGWLAWLAVCAVGLLLPGRSTHTVAGFVIACAALGALVVSRLIDNIRTDSRRHGAGLVGSISALSLMIGLFACVSALQFASSGGASAIISFVVAILAIAGVCMLYSANTPALLSVRAAFAGILVLLGLYTLSKGYNLAINRPNDPGEPFVTSAANADLGHLRQRLERIGTLALGDATALTLSVDDSAPASLRWAVRDLGETRFGALAASESAVLLPSNSELRDASGYIGDVFVIGSSASLDQLNCKQIGDKNDCSEYSRWLVLRQLENVERSQWVLWLRNDVAAQFGGRR